MKKYKLSPTAFINRASPLVERAYYKKPRKTLKRASKKSDEKKYSLTARLSHKNESMDIHTHNARKGQRMFIFPGKTDLESIRDKNIKDLKTWVIANKYNGKVVGYTFLRPIKKGSLKLSFSVLEKLWDSIQNESRVEFKKDFDKLVEKLNKAGFHVRFVPNLKKGFVYSDGAFVRARSKKQLQKGKKKRVSFLPKKNKRWFIFKEMNNCFIL